MENVETLDPSRSLVDGIHAGLDAIVAQFDDTGRARWPLLQTGERPEIPPLTRQLVYLRDGNKCSLCNTRSRLQLDHIVPWSAEGSDRSDNLRTLCWSHNRSRSNYRETYLPRVLPVVAACDPCLNAHETERWIADRHWQWKELGYGCPACMRGDWTTSDTTISAWCGTCTATSWTSHEGRLL